MIAPTIHGISKECCRPPVRGTIAGVAQHHRFRSPLCAPCAAARQLRIAQLVAEWETRPDASTPRGRAIRAFVEDYLYLLTTGETHPETIARRLGTNPRALERRLHRLGIHILHQPAQPARGGGGMKVSKAYGLRRHGTRNLEATRADDNTCPMCGKLISLTSGGKVRGHTDRQGNECPGSSRRVERGERRYQFDELPPVDLAPRRKRHNGRANPWSGKA